MRLGTSEASHPGALGPNRTLYAFDPRRAAILLIGGDKTGDVHGCGCGHGTNNLIAREANQTAHTVAADRAACQDHQLVEVGGGLSV